MPLIHSPSQGAFRANVSEMAKTHPIAQALAASYRNQRMAHAGGGGIQGYDDGGAMMGSGIGGPAPTAQTQNPSLQGVIQRYASLPVEKLQELSARMAGTPYAPIIQKILQQKQSQPQPQAAAPMASAAPAPQPLAMQARGGATPRRAMGGETASPWWEKSDASQAQRGGSGFLAGSTMGRADAVRTTSPAGAYILPADVVAGLGEGNSMAGARVVDEMLKSGPWGTSPVSQRRGSGPPRPPAIRAPQQDAKGGGVKGDVPAGRVPVLLSHGEYEVSVPDVVKIGGGNLKRGHKILDEFVLHQRKKHIAKLKSLPGPVKT